MRCVIAVLTLLAALGGNPAPQESASVEISGKEHPELIPDRDAYWMLLLTVSDGPQAFSPGARREFLRPFGLTDAQVDHVLRVANQYRAASAELQTQRGAVDTVQMGARQVEALEEAIQRLRAGLDSEARWRLKRFLELSVKSTMVLTRPAGTTAPPAWKPAPPPMLDAAGWKNLGALLHSSDWRQREKGFHALAEYECDEPKTAEATFELLRVENAYVQEQSAKEIGVAEAWGDPYYSELLGFTFSCFKKAPRPEWFRKLALGRYNPESQFAKELAGHVGDNLPWLLSVAPAQSSQYWRASLYGVLVETLPRHPAWGASERKAVLSVVERGQTDPEMYVVMSTAAALAYSGVAEGRDLLVKARPQVAKRPAVDTNLHSFDKLIAKAEAK